jgi:hypothetical protein
MESRTTGKAERARLDGFIRVTTGRAPYCAGGIGSAAGRWPTGGVVVARRRPTWKK